MHSTEGHGPREETHSRLSRLGPAESGPPKVRRREHRTELKIVEGNLADAIEDVDALRRAIAGALQTLRTELQRMSNNGDVFDTTWP